jgi:hypothetical protein
LQEVNKSARRQASDNSSVSRRDRSDDQRDSGRSGSRDGSRDAGNRDAGGSRDAGNRDARRRSNVEPLGDRRRWHSGWRTNIDLSRRETDSNFRIAVPE